MKIILLFIFCCIVSINTNAAYSDHTDINEGNFKCILIIKNIKYVADLHVKFAQRNEQLAATARDIEELNALLDKVDLVKFRTLATSARAKADQGKIFVKELEGKTYSDERKTGKLIECEKVKNLVEQEKKIIDAFRKELSTLILKLAGAVPGIESEGSDTEVNTTKNYGYRKHTFQDREFELYVAKPSRLEIFLQEKNGVYGNLSNFAKHLPKNKYIGFAINGGIFEVGGWPKGLYIENHSELVEVDRNNSSANEGNFYLQPNGVFLIDSKNNAFVITTGDYLEKYKRGRDENKLPRLATQSGPMLLITGKVNPSFSALSKNYNIRVGVGVLPTGDVVFVKSIAPVNFHLFASFFKNLGCYNALYLDGGPIAVMYTEGRSKNAFDNQMGPIIGIVNKR